MNEKDTIESVVLKIPTTLVALVEALIFAAPEPLSISQIRTVCQDENNQIDESSKIEPEFVRQIIADLNAAYLREDRPYRIVEIAGGYQFATLPDYAGWLGKLYKEQGRRKLSQSGIEALAIVAYKQPITKAEVEKIRGVNCDYVMKTLLEKELLTVIGRAESVGRPLLYGTTKEFLKHFGLNDIIDLPRPREIEEILGETQFETERRMLEAQANAEQAKKEQEDFKSRLPHIPKKKTGLDDREVEIVPRRKTRQIKIVPSEYRKVLEEAGQEKIEFKSEEELPVESAQLISQLIEEKDVELHTELPLEKVTLEILEQTPSVSDKEQAETAIITEVLENKVEIAVEQEPDIELDFIETERLEPIGSAEVKTLMADDVHQKSRWKVWKEKIQGFIKKLFD